MAVNLSTCIYNDIAPVALSIGDVRVSSTSQASSRGIPFDIGGQLFSASPALNDNNTWVVQTLSCANTTDYACIASFGGTYTPVPGVKASSDPTAWNGTAADWLQNGQYNSIFYNDAVRIGPSTLYGMPFYSYQYSASSQYNGTADPAGLSLATNSSFLKAALDARMIGTKRWSMWPGNMYNNVDGLLVLGGYDRARLGGPLQEFTMDKETNRAYVQITRMEFSNSTKTTDLMGGTSRIWAFIEPYTDLVTLPRASYSTWLNTTGGVWSNITQRNEWASIPQGNLTITFNNGYKTTIPAEDLFRRPTTYNGQGVLTVTNSTKYYQRVNLKDDKADMILGTPFLTQKMLITDWDKGTFALADAIKTKMTVSDRQIQSLCTPAGAPSTPTHSDSPKSGGTNVAAIAGGIGGGIGGLIVIGLIAFFLLRRRRNKKTQAAAPHSEITQYPAADPPKYPSVDVYDAGHGPAVSTGPVHTNAPIAEMHSPPPASPQTSYAQHNWRDSRIDPYNDNQTVVNSTTSGSDTHHNSRAPIDGSYLSATSGPLELPSSSEMHYNTQR